MHSKKSPRKERRKSSGSKPSPEQKRKPSESDVDFHFAAQFANFNIGPNPTGPRCQRRPSHEQLERAEAQFQQAIGAEFATLQQYYPSGSHPNPERFTLDALKCAVRRFRWDNEAQVLRCPISLSSYHRKFLHQEAFDLGGLRSISIGEGDARFLVIVKKDLPLD
ncbi:hypothetical protein K493DRAFT_86747 [Basidiobolus meristosporus CBS 931.73]|uniref:R3H domain-containing protein n=1 Tax=Basidiobolus meristosporus CBS 931.73 TaxID=1314790 RepID=A0A1Y1XG87_9FUNG|nr:hypothetical protein K493DRAFT_86747 [Basidiobolus meristosporus CBS 931.73]|eukprot:ORX84779.1 hypothetical protein K493DRAFT_86747 [Basidiobolus meristosporus CBS 931.73]